MKGGLNTYAYVKGNPIKHADPTGKIVFLAPLIPYIPAIAETIWVIAEVAIATEVADHIYEDSKDKPAPLPDDDSSDCGCWKILEGRTSWHEGDWIYQECLRNCKKDKDCKQ